MGKLIQKTSAQNKQGKVTTKMQQEKTEKQETGGMQLNKFMHECKLNVKIKFLSLSVT